MKVAHQRDCKPLMDYHALVGEWFYLRVHIPQSRGLHQLFSLMFYFWFNNPGHGKHDSPETCPTVDSAGGSGNWYCYFHVIKLGCFLACATHVIIFLPVLFINLFVHFDNIKAKEGS